MKRTVKIDPFFTKQPPLAFVEELKRPLHEQKPSGYGKRTKKDTEVDVCGMYLDGEYPQDPKRVLETVYADFNRFLKVYQIGGSRFPVRLEKGKTERFEAYKVMVSANEIRIIAEDTEGIRRGLIYLEDELRRRENAFLEPGETVRIPKIHARITRCFFSPINRPPKYGDELSDDMDYYPEEYLNRIMHDGANGVWIYTRFSDLLPSSVITENGKEYEKRIEKLNRVIEKCARYGIGVYVFAIEPIALTPGQVKKYPQLAGSRFGSGEEPSATFCTNSPEGKAYCYEAGAKLMELAPGLAGYIDITQGERITTCASFSKACNCPRCKGKKPGYVLSDAVEAMRAGIRDRKPECKTVSWTYGARTWEFEDIRDYVKTAPDDVMLMQNFEEMGYEMQAGRLRQCVDYWLSYIGPSQLFKVTARQAQESGKHMYAKMQVCCSHEIASVPYVPVPGILYQKYKRATELGVEGIMQCWYFGNYPSLMSKVAGELAFEQKYDDEEGFLKRIAAIYWGYEKAEQVVKVWKEFQAGYIQYPMNIMFSYYGPMQDGVVWKLSLNPKNYSLPRTWQTSDPADGDRIGECMLNGHKIREVLTLLEELCRHWEKGIELLSEIRRDNKDEEEQFILAEAIQILFASGRNIIKFYQLREELGLQKADPVKLLQQMRRLVLQEIENSEKMIPLCRKDGRLGYHSEGEGYKFFEEKIRDRIEDLRNLLKTEFTEVEKRIAQKKIPLGYYAAEEDNDSVKRYHMSGKGLENAPWEVIDREQNRKFRMAYDAEYFYLEWLSDRQEDTILSPEFRLLWPGADILIHPDGKAELTYEGRMYFGLFGEYGEAELKKYSDICVIPDKGMHLFLKIRKEDICKEEPRPMKMRLKIGSALWCEEENPVRTLGKANVSPGDYGWLLCDD